MILNIRANRTLARLMEASTKVVALEGSQGSGKTYAALQKLLACSFQEVGKTYSVVRATLPAHKKGAIRDWRKILENHGVTQFFDERKTEHTWTNIQTGTKIEFFGLDQGGQKKGAAEHGARRDRLYLNEIPSISYAAYTQLSGRTSIQTIVDWNPKMQRHWVYDKVLTRDDCTHIHSTYKDNPDLPEGEVQEIESHVPVYEEADGTRIVDWKAEYEGSGHLVSGDPYHWQVYGLGQRGAPSEAIYGPCGITHTMPEDFVYGLDFGFNHPNVLLAIGLVDAPDRMQLHVDQVIHESGMTTSDLTARMADVGVDKSVPMYCDGARPEIIQELQNSGYNAQPADKSQGSVYAGIQYVKGHTILFTPRSELSKQQTEDYMWQKRQDDTVDDKPVKINDDAPDALRYGAFTHWNKPVVDYSRGAF